MHKFRVGLSFLLAVVVLLPGVGFAKAKPDNAQGVTKTDELRVFDNLNSGSAEQYVSDEVVFKFKNDTERFRVMKVKNVPQAVAALSRNPNIEFAEPNYIAQAAYLPNDPYYTYQWNFDNAVYGGVHAEPAWDLSSGAGVTVAVIDTGIAYETYNAGTKQYYQAPDLAGTCFVPGYDYINNDTHPNDDNSHGTHVAGTIAQTTGNSLGTAGLAHSACLMPVKALDANGSGSFSAIANAIYFATDNGAKVISMSFGASTGSSVLLSAIQYAYQHGVTLVAAAGNSNGPVGYPAAYDAYVIAVGATRFDEARAPYSSYGASLDIVAPGGDTSVDQNGDGYTDGVVQQTFNPNTKNVGDFGYWFFQGTSMATPHAAAAAAMVISKGNVTAPDAVRAALESTADDIGAVGRDNYFGNGLLNIAAALSSGPADNPPSVSMTAPSNGATVSGVVAISANANDDNGVNRVEFSVDGALIATDTTSPYSADWNSLSYSEGTHSLRATAYDTIGQFRDSTVSVKLDNVNDAPIANAGPDQNGYVGVALNFSGAGSNDDRGISSYEWNFGDGITASGVSVSHAYEVVGTYTVTLRVTDTGGLQAEDKAQVTVSTAPSQGTVMTVMSIDYSTVGSAKRPRELRISPLVHDNLGYPVSGASMSLVVYNETTGQMWIGIGITGTDGRETFIIKSPPSGCYSTTMANVLKDGMTWDGTTPTNRYCR